MKSKRKKLNKEARSKLAEEKKREKMRRGRLDWRRSAFKENRNGKKSIRYHGRYLLLRVRLKVQVVSLIKLF